MIYNDMLLFFYIKYVFGNNMVAKTRKATSDTTALLGLKYQRLHPSNEKMDATSATPVLSGSSSKNSVALAHRA